MTTTRAEARTFINAEGLSLEGWLELPDEPGPVPGVVLCHPHPLYGGQMHDGILVPLSEMLTGLGIAALRFNFRGVGRSDGQHDGGVGEVDDARAAIAALAGEGRVDGERIGLAGYSFGAGVALNAAQAETAVRALALIACPPTGLETPEAARMTMPKMLIAGSQDTLISPVRLRAAAEGLREPKEVHVIEGADHFFAGSAHRVAERVARFFAGALGEGASMGGRAGARA